MGKRVVCVVLLGLLFLCQGCGAADPLTLTQSIFTIELGDSLDENPSSYLQTKNAEVLENAKFNFKEVDTSQTGVYRATVSYQSKREEFKIEVKDTTAPEAGIKQTINGEAGKLIYARDMITELTEPSGTVEIQFKDHTYEQDSSSENENIDGVDCNTIAVCYVDEGEYDNTMSLKDESGNSVEIPVHITISMNPNITETNDITENTDESDAKNTDNKARKQKNEKKVKTEKKSKAINQNPDGRGSDNNITNEEQKTQDNAQPEQPETQKESTEKVDNNQVQSEKEPTKEETVKEDPAKQDPAKEDPQNPGTEGEKNSESNSENGGTSNNSADSETSGENASDSR